MKNILIILNLICPIFLHAQQLISLKNAIDTALKNNFDIQIARNNFEIKKINNNYGNAGGLPSINASIGNSYNFYNAYYQKYSGGNVTNLNTVNGSNLNAEINATITLFNGLKIIATKERFNLLQKQSEIELNMKIQNTIASIMAVYFDIVRQQGYLKIIQSSMELSKKKFEIVILRKNVGMANDADYLQSRIDLNIAEQNIKGQTIIINKAKADLMQLMSVKKYFPVIINDSIVIDEKIRLDSIINFLMNNPQYLSAEMQININAQILKEVAAMRYPTVRFNTGYNFIDSKSDVGSILSSQNYGPFLGFSLQIPIYNGNVYKIQHDVAKYNLSNAMLEKESLLHSIKTEVEKTYFSYSGTLEQITSQRNNYELSKELVNIVLDRFQLNQATILDVKTAQESFENTAYMLINLQYSAKIAEIELKRLVYKLCYN